MLALLRALAYASIFVAILLVLLPARILEGAGIGRPADPGAVRWAGAVITVLGAALAAWSVLTFSLVGRGTPAPFDPPRRLVVSGPYRWLRNPMYAGAFLALCGAAVFYGSWALAGYAALFLLLTNAMIRFYEEPALGRKFGADYAAYRGRVGRWWPRRAGTGRGPPALVVAALASGALAGACVPGADPGARDWPVTGGGPGNDRYSGLDQIDRTNVHRLERAWMFHTGEPDARQIQATPVVVDGVLYATTGAGALFALRADTGEELWRYDPLEGTGVRTGVNRGVVHWADGDDRRVLYPAGPWLHAVDAATGEPIPGFGDGGRVDLAAGLGREVPEGSVSATSPGIAYGDLLVQGTRVGEEDGSAPGHIRAYDIRTGRVRWTFRTIPHPGEAGHETWPAEAWRTAGGANSWAGLALDRERGIVYVPTGSATPDFYGGFRTGANLFANSLLALDAATGERLWHFQSVHHDVLDRDLPAAPSLLTVDRDGREVDAVAQITKSGFVFLFDRVTGDPLFPIEERPVPQSDVPGETTWPTQPFPVAPAPFARQRLTVDSLTRLSPASRTAVRARFDSLRSDGPFAPPTFGGTVVFPGFDGGGEWGGAAVDPATGVLYVNASDIPWIATLVPNDRGPAAEAAPRSGEAVFASACAPCHGADLQGDGARTPPLEDVAGRLSREEVLSVIDLGRGFMPGFAAAIPAAEREAVAAYLLGERGAPAGSRPGEGDVAADAAGPRSPYRLRSYERWRDPEGYPAVKPPWGTLSAIDMDTGEYLWRIPLGEHPELTARGVPATGTEQYGGPIVTAGGLVFIAATMDEKLRALDSRTGEILWEGQLPAAGYATPATYAVGGRQYVVIAAGGGKLGTRAGDAYVAFALPDGEASRP
jgi:quinoprotein glucose dehydrogenase